MGSLLPFESCPDRRSPDIESDEQLHAARWELVAFPEIRDLRRTGPDGHVTIVFDGDQPAVENWLAMPEQAGYRERLAA